MEEKITSKSGLDQNTFDGLFQTVLEHLESKCYPNFLTSEVYIEYVQSYQTQECSEGASIKYQSSTASSISGHPQKNADDSGIAFVYIFVIRAVCLQFFCLQNFFRYLWNHNVRKTHD